MAVPNWDEVNQALTVVSMVIATASGMSAFLPTKVWKWIPVIGKVVDLLALNVKNARNIKLPD